MIIQRDGLGWGLVRKDYFSLGRSFFLLHARRRSESCCMVFWMAALVAAIGRLGRVSAMGRVAGVGGGARSSLPLKHSGSGGLLESSVGAEVY